MTEHYENLESLIKQLEKIQSDGHGAFSPVQAIYLLAKEVQHLTIALDCMFPVKDDELSPESLSALREAIKQASAGDLHNLGSFEKYLEDD